MARMNVADALDKYSRAKEIRRPHETQFRLNAAYCLPRDYSRWQSSDVGGGPTDGRTNNEVQARFAFDNTGVNAIPKYVAICKRLVTPDNIRYHKFSPSNDALARIPAVRMYFDEVTDMVFRMRQTPAAGHGTAQAEMYASIGVYGTGPKSLTWRPEGGYRYRAWPLYDQFFLTDDMGNNTDGARRFALTKRMFQLKWPNDPLPPKLKNLKDGDQTRAEFVHLLSLRNGDYDPNALDSRRMKWSASYIAVDDHMYIGDEEGFLSNPYFYPRAMTIAGDPYGYAPAEQAFPALGGVNAQKKTLIKAGHKAVDPPLLSRDDGVLSGRVDQRPGRVTHGGLDSQGREMVKPMVNGSNFQIAENMIADERKDINDSFMVSLFQILTETPEMTAAELYERVAEKAALFAPTKAALEEQDQGPQTEREIELAAEHRMLPPMPPELVEAKGEYKITYTNPMNKAMHASEVSGFLRWVEMLTQASAASGDPRPMDWIGWDRAAPEVGDKMDVRAAWVSTPDEVKQQRGDRQQATQQQHMVDAAPAAASVAATFAKNGLPLQGVSPNGRPN